MIFWSIQSTFTITIYFHSLLMILFSKNFFLSPECALFMTIPLKSLSLRIWIFHLWCSVTAISQRAICYENSNYSFFWTAESSYHLRFFCLLKFTRGMAMFFQNQRKTLSKIYINVKIFSAYSLWVTCGNRRPAGPPPILRLFRLASVALFQSVDWPSMSGKVRFSYIWTNTCGLQKRETYFSLN